MRNMSFMLTTEQIRNRTKTVTRRLGWTFLKPGDLIQAIEKGQGLRKGEKINRLAVLRVENVRREVLAEGINAASKWLESSGRHEVKREGFGEMAPVAFVLMFCKANKCTPSAEVTRIEFSYVDPVDVTDDSSSTDRGGK